MAVDNVVVGRVTVEIEDGSDADVGGGAAVVKLLAVKRIGDVVGVVSLLLVVSGAVEAREKAVTVRVAADVFVAGSVEVGAAAAVVVLGGSLTLVGISEAGPAVVAAGVVPSGAADVVARVVVVVVVLVDVTSIAGVAGKVVAATVKATGVAKARFDDVAR
jgi:hypothetical protein